MNNKFLVYQNNEDLNKYIQQSGCYLLCLHYYIALYKDRFFCAHNVNENYDKFVRRKYILPNCYIMDPTAIFYDYKIHCIVKKTSVFYECADNEFEITRVNIKGIDSGHFLVTNANKVVYDSLRLDERKIQYTSVSKRIFTLV